jgi:uncharacterized Ntn-hydrolase superfamily protein
MTWSIVARDATGAYGIAIASRAFAVGVLCPHAQSRVGAIATQALVNPHYGPRGVSLLARGVAADDVIAQLTAADEGREHRQVHAIDTAGRCAAFTGNACIGWCGHRLFAGYSVAGNMLAGPRVIEGTAAAYAAAGGRPFAERLLAAMDAGEAAGGDKRGKQGAALLIYTTEEYPFLDLRVDDHPEPLVELRRLYEASFERFQPFVACLPSRARPAGITDRSVIEAEIERFAAAHAKSKGE